ncbi:hypothetical protein OYC64_013381 [Pagothenia borchgrevinki]|uniref:Uncharacterized protein n=1 Tax=Pagothenia borchgrevinki TaxID=8213 RepID=A0ABD2FU49_PAGBO
MKVVFALVVLLHLCHSNNNIKQVYTEIIKELNKLDPANISLQTVWVPSFDTTKDQSSCVRFYVNALKSLLGNVTVNKSNKHIIQGLQATLQILNPEDQHNCTMKLSPIINRHFKPYIRFFRKLNSMK